MVVKWSPLEPQALVRESQLGIVEFSETSKSISSDTPPPTRPQVLIPPSQFHQVEDKVFTPVSLWEWGGILIQTSTQHITFLGFWIIDQGWAVSLVLCSRKYYQVSSLKKLDILKLMVMVYKYCWLHTQMYLLWKIFYVSLWNLVSKC